MPKGDELMKIKKINITSFGKLSDFELKPSNGLNIIYAPNESGKTTILSFLKYIFYGTKQKKQAGELTFKEKYTPWNSSNIAGSCELSVSNETYTIQRCEGEHGSKLSVFDLKTNDVRKDISNPGMYFMKIGERAFTDSCFITNIHSITDSSSDGELISFLSDSCNDKSTYAKIHQELTEKHLQLVSDKRKASSLSLVNKEISENEQKLLSLKNKKANLEFQIQKICEYEKTVSQLKAETEELIAQKSKIEFNELKNELNSLKEEKKKLKLALSALNSENNNSFDDVSPEEEAILSCDFSEYKSNITDCKLHSLKEMMLLCLAVFCTLAVSACAIYFKIALLALPFAMVFAFISLNALLKSKRKLKNIISQYSFDIQKQKAVMNKYNLLSRNDCINFISSLKSNQSVSMAANHQRNYLTKHIEHINQLIEKNSAKINELSLGADASTNSLHYNIKFFTNGDINDIINENNKKINELSLFVVRNLHLKEELEKVKLDIILLTEELAVLNNRKEEICQKAEVIDSAILILNKAFAEAKNTFFPLLSQRCAEIFNYITNGSECEIKSNDKFELFFSDSGYIRNAKFLSRGTLDILYFSLRIAIISIISKNGLNLPVFLDDVFANCDDERTFRLMEVILKLSQKYQVFLCTCRGREGEFFKDNKDVNIISI